MSTSVSITLATGDVKKCSGCGGPRHFTGPPINEYYCADPSCNYEKEQMTRGLREITQQRDVMLGWRPMSSAPTEPSVGMRGRLIVGVDAEGTVANMFWCPDMHNRGSGWLMTGRDGSLYKWEPTYWCENPVGDFLTHKPGRDYEREQ